jgi:hypothetical protein
MEYNKWKADDTGAIGYRLVYRIEDKLFSLEAIDHILSLTESTVLATTENAIAKLDYTEKGIINTDIRGQGYYYFSDRDIAEDYMKVFIYKSAERYKLKSGYFELYRVYGVSRHNARGAEGFVMDEMMYEPEPIVSFKAEDVYKAVHN